MKILTNILLAVLIIIYPIGVYFGLQYLEPGIIAAGFILVIVLRFLLHKKKSKALPWVNMTAIVGVVVLLSSAFTNHRYGLLFYPVLINLALLSVFAWSYYKKPTVIESLARLSGDDLDDRAVRYTEKVTLAWCIFFLCNALVSGYTVLFMTLEQWTLYNGLIAYVLIGIFFAIEYLIRITVKRRHKNEL